MSENRRELAHLLGRMTYSELDAFTCDVVTIVQDAMKDEDQDPIRETALSLMDWARSNITNPEQ